MPLDPQVGRYLERQAAAAGPLPGSVQERRDQRIAQAQMQVEDRTIQGPGGSLPLRIYWPPGPRPLPVLVYYHGGGWVIGNLDTHDFQCRLMASWAGCMVVHVNYRHAPEHVFPAAIDDAYAGACWVEENAAALGADAGRIAVGGDSAGGNLAAAVALMARERGAPRLALQYLAYPVMDASMGLPSYNENANGYGLTAEGMAWFWDQYVPDLADRSNPLASPLQAPDLSGLAPALVMTAEFDPLRDEGEAYARRLKEAGVPVELKRYEGLVHGFLAQTGEIDGARVAMADLVRALRGAFGTSTD